MSDEAELRHAAWQVILAHRQLEATQRAVFSGSMEHEYQQWADTLSASIKAMDTSVEALRMHLPPGVAPGDPICWATYTVAALSGFWHCNLPPRHDGDHQCWDGGKLAQAWPQLADPAAAGPPP